MMMKRVYLSLLAIGLISILVAGGTMALFTAQTANINNTFTSGKVSLDDSAFLAVTVDKIVPGDSGTESFPVTYTGNVPAYLGVIATASGSMIGCDAANPFTASLSDTAGSYPIDGAIHSMGVYAPGQATTLEVDWALPLLAGNGCQSDTYQLDLQVKAVQQKNNDDGAAPLLWN